MNKINLYEEPVIKDDDWLPLWPSSHGEHIKENVIFPSENVKFNDTLKRKNILKMRQTENNFKLKIIKFGIQLVHNERFSSFIVTWI